MEFGFTPEQEKYQKEVRDFYLNELPEDFVWHIAPMNEAMQSLYLQLQKKAAAGGYLVPGWPKEYGGSGQSNIEQGIAQEEQGRAGVWWPNMVGYSLAGPAVLLFGTEEQKKKFLPAIGRGEAVWFQAFTEPDAGTDEANQQTRAVPDGDDFIINGQKTFITGVFKPDYLYTELRTKDTNPKHRGLSLFLIPADLPGITYRPLPTMDGVAQNEIFFDDVRVPKDYLLGELNRGFYHAMATFEFERSGTEFPARARSVLERLIHFCKEEKRNGKLLIEDPEIRQSLAQMTVELEVYRLIAWHTVWWFSEREKLGPKPFDLTGYYEKMITMRHAEKMMKIMGLYGQLRTGSKWAKLAGEIELLWQAARSRHAAGTWEANKIILAARGLGLPRVPAQFNTMITDALKEKG